MLKTFYLITNISGMKYWSYLGTPENNWGGNETMAAKYGEIYINDCGGWFNRESIRECHAIVTQLDFPKNIDCY